MKMQEYLTNTEIIDHQHPDILQLARQLAAKDLNTTAKACSDQSIQSNYLCFKSIKT